MKKNVQIERKINNGFPMIQFGQNFIFFWSVIFSN